MDASVLANKLKNLEMSWASLDFWLKFWILLVVIGVSIELFVVLTEYLHNLRDFRRATIHTPDKPSTWLLIFGLLGAGLVAIGVAGEFFIHIKAGRIETDMRTTTETFVALVSKAARKAKQAAEAERLERVKLEQRLADRHLTLEQRKQMLAILKERPGTKVSVTYLINADKDAQECSIEIGGAFHDAGWDVLPEPHLTSSDNPVHGFAVQVQHDSPSNALASLSEKALSVTGYGVVRWPPPNPATSAGSVAFIFVGSK
jgi:hypothetical protein